MRVFAARHGETQWNAENKVCGRTDLPLTDRGFQQAQMLAEKAVSCDLDVIISSPMLRARQTAGAVAENAACRYWWMTVSLSRTMAFTRVWTVMTADF